MEFIQFGPLINLFMFIILFLHPAAETFQSELLSSFEVQQETNAGPTAEVVLVDIFI